MKRKTDKCLLCKKTIFDEYWVYQWRGKSGYTCDDCGKAIHEAGDKILSSINGILVRNGIQNTYFKEKFGHYEFTGTAITPDQLRLAEALFQQARKDFPEFTFYFYVSLQHTNYAVQ